LLSKQWGLIFGSNSYSHKRRTWLYCVSERSRLSNAGRRA
jgi:hypothetical protein